MGVLRLTASGAVVSKYERTRIIVVRQRYQNSHPGEVDEAIKEVTIKQEMVEKAKMKHKHLQLASEDRALLKQLVKMWLLGWLPGPASRWIEYLNRLKTWGGGKVKFNKD